MRWIPPSLRPSPSAAKAKSRCSCRGRTRAKPLLRRTAAFPASTLDRSFVWWKFCSANPFFIICLGLIKSSLQFTSNASLLSSSRCLRPVMTFLRRAPPPPALSPPPTSRPLNRRGSRPVTGSAAMLRAIKKKKSQPPPGCDLILGPV